MMRRSVLLVGLLLVGLIFSPAANAAEDGTVCRGVIGAAPRQLQVWLRSTPNGITVWTKALEGPNALDPNKVSKMPPAEAPVLPNQKPEILEGWMLVQGYNLGGSQLQGISVLPRNGGNGFQSVAGKTGQPKDLICG
jgi:hypothetical protein